MAALLLIFVVCLFSFSSADGQERVLGPDFLVTDGTNNLTLTCPADISSGQQYTWFTPGIDTTRCVTRQEGKVCIFIPRLEDDSKNVTCQVTSIGVVVSFAFYHVNLKYPPQSNPTINTESPQKKSLKHGDNITCTVSGGKPRVTNITFHCQHPDLAGRTDDVSDDGITVSSSITVHLTNTTGVYMNCTCSSTWQPEPELYLDKTTMSVLLETSPRIMDSSYDPLNPPIVEATGHTFFLVADPTPDNITSYFIETNMTKKHAPENTFKTEFIRNTTMEHLVNCRVTPQNVPEENLGLYELSISNRLGDVSLRFNVMSPVIQHREEKAIDTGVLVGGVIGGIGLLLGIIVTIVIFIIRRKRCAGYKGHDDSTPAISNMPPTATSHDVQPDANGKINACPSYTFIESEPGYATPGEVRKTDCRSTDSKSGTIINSEQDDYNHLNENNAPPVDSSIYSRVDADSRGAQPDVSTDSAKPNSLAPNYNTSTGKITLPNGDEYSTVGHQQKGGNPPPTDEE